jgi:hypothetical protein
MSNGPQFFETGMGKKYYDGTMPRIAKALEEIAKKIDVLAATNRLAGDAELFRELVDLLYDHHAAWDDEEDSVKEEHAALIARTRELLGRVR